MLKLTTNLLTVINDGEDNIDQDHQVAVISDEYALKVFMGGDEKESPFLFIERRGQCWFVCVHVNQQQSDDPAGYLVIRDGEDAKKHGEEVVVVAENGGLMRWAEQLPDNLD